MAQVFIGLGSNLENPKQQLEAAVRLIKASADFTNVVVSSFYASQPQGPVDQPDYINAVARVETDLVPETLLIKLQRMECQLGKVKVRHWGERKIDLDILLYGDLCLNTPDLQIPHPQLSFRDFVLLPLQEISPDLIIPNIGPIDMLVSGLQERFVYPYVSS